VQSYFLANDLDLYDADTDQPVIVKTTSLLEDLGQVRLFVFSAVLAQGEKCARLAL
jgi:hypothetical protein